MPKIGELTVGVRYVKCSECEREEVIESLWHKEYIPDDGDAEVVYFCGRCGSSALNDYRGRSTDSHFCPNCGAKMVNSTVPAD